ncbi:MAG TPA: hypothetical protein VGQ75_04545 [Thermoanaerobaculia bacterium]|nr:hypothetical protein [Thermoanaerobaculia bacterium]
MSRCLRPLDPIDAEAVASGAEPVLAPDAAEHAAVCPACGDLVGQARDLDRALGDLSGALPPLSGLAERVTRLRGFSRRERRTYALWKAPVLLAGAIGVAGLTLLLLPSLSAGEPARVGATALVPILAFARSLARWFPDSARVTPYGLEALSDALRQERALGLVSLLLLLPAGFGVTRVFGRARSRR